MEKMSLLPLEMWMAIMNYLSAWDLCQLALVSVKMRNIAAHPLAWANRGSKINKMKMATNVCNESETFFLDIPRFSKIKELDLSGNRLLHSQYVFLLTKIISSPTIKCVILNQLDYRAIPAKLLGQTLKKLKKLSLRIMHPHKNSKIPEWIIWTTVVFNEIECSKTLLDLDISYSAISTIGSLGPAIANLVKLNMANTNFVGMDPIAPMFTSVIQHMGISMSLLDVNLSGVNLSQVPDHLFAPALIHLQRINLTRTNLNTNQATEVIRCIGMFKSLKEVILTRINLSQVPADLIGKAFSYIEKVYLDFTRLSKAQLTTMLRNPMAARDINLSGVNLSQVPVDLVVNCLNYNVQKLNLLSTTLGLEQIIAILRKMVTVKAIKEINLSCNNMNKVPVGILVDATVSLESVYLKDIQLTEEAKMIVLAHILISPGLVHFELDLNSKYLAYVNETRRKRFSRRARNQIQCELITKAIDHIRKTFVRLTHHQTKALFRHLASLNEILCTCDGNVDCVSLAGFDLSKVPAHVLCTWMAKVQKLNLANTNLNTEQLTRILNQSKGRPVEINLSGLNLSQVSPDLLLGSLSAATKVDLTRTQLTEKQVEVLTLMLPTELTKEEMELWRNLVQQS